MLSCLAVSVLQGDMRTHSMEAVPAPKFFSIAERFVSYADIRKEILTNGGVMQGIHCLTDKLLEVSCQKLSTSI